MCQTHRWFLAVDLQDGGQRSIHVVLHGLTRVLHLNRMRPTADVQYRSVKVLPHGSGIKCCRHDDEPQSRALGLHTGRVQGTTRMTALSQSPQAQEIWRWAKGPKAREVVRCAASIMGSDGPTCTSFRSANNTSVCTVRSCASSSRMTEYLESWRSPITSRSSMPSVMYCTSNQSDRCVLACVHVDIEAAVYDRRQSLTLLPGSSRLHACHPHLDCRGAARLIVETNPVAHLRTERNATLLGHSLRNRHGCNAPGLRAGDSTTIAETRLEKILGKLSRLAATRFPNNYQRTSIP